MFENFLNSPPPPPYPPNKLEMNIVLNVKQKQERIASTPLRVRRPLKVSLMNMTVFFSMKLDMCNECTISVSDA